MKGEIPVFKRCCCCLPLRYGLLAWGYFKMTANAFLVSLMAYLIIVTLVVLRLNEDHIRQISTELILSIITLTVFFTDFVVTIVFIVGGHKKNVKLMRLFYFFNMGMCVITALFTGIAVVIAIHNLFVYTMRHWARVMVPLSFYFVVLVVQIYFLLLLRSEIIKIKKRTNGKFRFVNNAAEAEEECTITFEEKVVGEGTVKEVIV